MTDEDVRHKKGVGAKLARRAIRATKMHVSKETPEPTEEILEWSASMARARGAAETLWEAYLTEDPVSFVEVFARIQPGPSEIRLLVNIAHHQPSPDAASLLGAASASRYEPTKEKIRAAWQNALEQGTKKSKRQFVRDWIHQQNWGEGSAAMKEKALYECLPKSEKK